MALTFIFVPKLINIILPDHLLNFLNTFYFK